MTLVDGIDTGKVFKTASRILSVGIVLGSLVAFGWVASRAFQATDGLSQVQWTPFIGAIALQLAMLFVLMFAWERLMGFLWVPQGGEAARPARPSLYTAYSRSWLARYIPGRIWSLGGRALMANRLGVPVEAVARSMIIEVLFTYALVTIIGGSLLLAASFHILSGGALLIIGFAAFTASVPIAQKILRSSLSSTQSGSTWSKLRQRAHRLLIGDSYFSLPNTVWGVFVYGFYSTMQLGFIVLIAASFADLNIQQAAIIAGAWGVSLTLGWISFLAPAGLGVRDGLAFVLFSQVLDPTTAGLIVTTSRVVMLAVDLVFVGAVELLALGLGLKQTRVYDASRI